MDGFEYTAAFEAPGGRPILRAYPDPISKGDPWTIGLGETGPDVKEGTIWPEEKCWSRFYNSYAIAYAAAARDAGSSCWSGLNEQRRAVLTDLAFQMGGEGLAGFTHMLAAVKAADWAGAKAHMLKSEYAKQTPSRAETNAQMILTGEWPDELEA
jgi:lysozyme